ncbi:ADAMTS17 isoform 7, partial [Pongo abelii]
MCDGALLPPLVLPVLLLLVWGPDPGTGWPHSAWAGAGANPAPQQLPGPIQWTRASDQAQMVLDPQPFCR